MAGTIRSSLAGSRIYSVQLRRATMKLMLVLCLVAVAAADKSARIRNYQYAIEEDGSYEATYETTNGIKAQEEGISYPGSKPETGNYVRNGSFTYEWEGVTYTVEWTADENGYHPKGDHLPDFSHTREHIQDVSQHE